MKKFSLLFLMLTAALFLCQCSDKPKDRRSVDGVQASTLSPDDSVITTSQLAEIGVDSAILRKHLKLQTRAWYGGDFRDDQSIPRYEPTKTDFLLTLPFVERYLYLHGFRQPSRELFAKTIKRVFGHTLLMDSKRKYVNLAGVQSFDFASGFIAVKDRRFVTYSWLLRDLIEVRGNKITFKNTALKQILWLNQFVFYNDLKALKALETFKYEGDDDDLGDYYDSKGMLNDLINDYDYYASPQLNQWLFNQEKEYPTNFFNRIFQRDDKKRFVAHPELIETIERNITGKNSDLYNVNLALFIDYVISDREGANIYHFNTEEKARILCYIAKSEYKMRDKFAYYIQKGMWPRVSETYRIMSNYPKVYQCARAHKFFGICSAAVMDNMDWEGRGVNPHDDTYNEDNN